MCGFTFVVRLPQKNRVCELYTDMNYAAMHGILFYLEVTVMKG
jgi:hypothetical protein